MSADVLVIGAGVSGLAAAACLARAGARVSILEKDEEPGGSCANRVLVGDFMVPIGPHALVALDPLLVKQLKLAKFGLAFAQRDLSLVALRADGTSLRLTRDLHEAQRSIAPLSPQDAERYGHYLRALFTFARSMRSLWWDEGDVTRQRDGVELHRLRLSAAANMLDSTFESEALRAALAFDAMPDGWSPAAAGSALIPSWRAAQEMCGLQGAVAIPRGGPARLVAALAAAAESAGVKIRTKAEVSELMVEGDAVSGAVLSNGEAVPAATVLSSLSRHKTLVDLLPVGVAGFATTRLLERPQEVGDGKLVLSLNAVPFTFKDPGRFVFAERLESLVTAHAEARAGKLPTELALESVTLDTGDKLLLSVLVRPLPVSPPEGWKALSTPLVQRVLRILERQAPDLTARIGGLALVPPRPCAPPNAEYLTSRWAERIATPLRGLFLCGEAAEPLPSVSGRAARIAAATAIRYLKERRA
jgi:phytoene dehydrogenase-like protein